MKRKTSRRACQLGVLVDRLTDRPAGFSEFDIPKRLCNWLSKKWPLAYREIAGEGRHVVVHYSDIVTTAATCSLVSRGFLRQLARKTRKSTSDACDQLFVQMAACNRAELSSLSPDDCTTWTFEFSEVVQLIQLSSSSPFKHRRMTRREDCA